MRNSQVNINVSIKAIFFGGKGQGGLGGNSLGRDRTSVSTILLSHFTPRLGSGLKEGLARFFQQQTRVNQPRKLRALIRVMSEE